MPLPRHAPCRATDARIVSVRGAFMHVCMHATLCSALHIREPRAHAYAYAYTFMHGRTSACHTGASCLVLSSLEGASRQRRRRHFSLPRTFLAHAPNPYPFLCQDPHPSALACARACAHAVSVSPRHTATPGPGAPARSHGRSGMSHRARASRAPRRRTNRTFHLGWRAVSQSLNPRIGARGRASGLTPAGAPHTHARTHACAMRRCTDL